MPMKPLPSVLALVLTAATAAAQQPQIFSRPAVPPREALERLNLVLGWHNYVPIEGRRDGIFSVQLTGRDILVQTRAGMIISLDPETGQTRWRTMPGLPYRDKQPLGYNSRLVVASNGTRLFAFDRGTGAQLWSYDLSGAPVAAPVADEEQLYVPMSGARLQVYFLAASPPPPATPPKRTDGAPPPGSEAPAGPGVMPRPGGGPGAPPPDVPVAPPKEIGGYLGPLSKMDFGPREVYTPPPLTLVYDQLFANAVDRAPLLTPEFLLAADTRGTLVGMSKFQQKEIFRFSTWGPIAAPLAQHGEIAYVVSEDQNLYVLNQVTGRVLWRFTTPAPVYWQPQVTDADVYLSPVGSGLYRLRRDTGELVWQSPGAQRLLAVNPKFVYATDRSGRLLVVDQRRGTVLSGYDTHDYVVPISNDGTDRVYLAANDGLIVCLHDRAYAAPVYARRALAPRPVPTKAPPPKRPPKPAAEKPKEGDMDKEK
jgi:outer membrane protein assembly factor BamB